MKRHLRPLALAANISQAAHIRPDQILFIFAMLYVQFRGFEDEDEATIRATMLSAIEARWAKVDQDVFIAAVILNPVHRTRPFSPLNILTTGGVYSLFLRLWKRFYGGQDVPQNLWKDTMDYVLQTGDYSIMQSYIDPICMDARARVRLLNTTQGVYSSDHTLSRRMSIRIRYKHGRHQNMSIYHVAHSRCSPIVFSRFAQIQHHANDFSAHLGQS